MESSEDKKIESLEKKIASLEKQLENQAPSSSLSPPDSTQSEAPKELSALEKKRASLLSNSLLGVFVLLTVGGYFWKGLDFAQGTLLGCVVVAINFFSIQKLVHKLLIEKTVPIWVIFLYMTKLAVSAAILFYGINKLNLDTLAIALGLSSILLATILSTILRGMMGKAS